MIHSKINKTNDANAWYTRKSTTKVMQTHDTLKICKSKFRVYHAFASLFLLIFECIMRLYHFCCWFSSVSCFSITFQVSTFNFQLESWKLKVEKWWEGMIHSKINNKRDTNAWYTWKLTKKWCKRMIHSKFRFANWVYHAFASLFLLIFECITRLHHLFCWFSSVSCVFITFFVDFRVYHAFPSLFKFQLSTFNFQLFNFSTFQLSNFQLSTFNFHFDWL